MTDRRYRILTVVLDEAVSFEEALATLRAIRMIRGVDEVEFAPTARPYTPPMEALHPYFDPANCEP